MSSFYQKSNLMHIHNHRKDGHYQYLANVLLYSENRKFKKITVKFLQQIPIIEYQIETLFSV